MDRKELAIQYHDKGFNCCQSVVLAFSDKTGIDPVTLSKIGEGFGAGMGGMNGTCGALSGVIMLAGILQADGDMEHPVSKRNTYKSVKVLHKEFGERCGSTICRDIKGLDTGKMLCSCPDAIRLGVSLAEEYLGL